MVKYISEDFSDKKITRHRSNMTPPKELFFQEQMAKHFSNNSLLRLHPQKPTITKSKSVSLNLDMPGIPSSYLDNPPINDLIPNLDYSRHAWKTALQKMKTALLKKTTDKRPQSL